MGEKTKNMLIGIFILVACFFVVSIILFLKPTVGDGKQTLYVRFSNLNGINVGTRVMFAGRPVGEVVAMEVIPNAREQPSDALGHVYFYQLTLHVDSSVKVYNTDEISIQTSGLLGEKSIAIIPRSPPIGITPKLITNQPIYANSIDPIENTFDEISELANKVEAAIDHFSKWMQDNGDEISYAIKKFGETMNQIDIAVTSINQEKLVQSVKTTIQHIDDTFTKVSSTINQMQQDGVFDNLAITMNHAKNTTRSFDTISKNIAQGKGTIGKLLENDDLYLHFNSLLSKVDTMMNDINHYGILFNQNKHWQRTRAKRITAMDSLDSPADFKNYFEGEVDQINTSMSRLALLLEKAERSPENQKIMQSTPFKKDFADFLRAIENLSDNIKLYNEKLQDEQQGE